MREREGGREGGREGEDKPLMMTSRYITYIND